MSFFLPRISRAPEDRFAFVHKQLLRRDAKTGGQLFGPLPKGHERQFFCLDEHTWIWHEQWIDKNGQDQSITTRYDIRPNGIIKIQNGGVYQRLSRNEAANFRRATKLYISRVKADHQQLLHSAA